MQKVVGGLLILYTVAVLLAGASIWHFVTVEEPLVQHLRTRIEMELQKHHSSWVSLQSVPSTMKVAMVATEDQSFWHNLGVSFEGIGRSVFVDLTTGRFTEGGSTLTQELARDQLLTLSKTISRKLKEMVISLMITHDYPKADILSMYLNQVYFGHGAYGLNMAAHIYFGRNPSALTPAESTMLAGLPRAPSYLDPLKNLKAAKVRQWQVLMSMVHTHKISLSTAKGIYKDPLGLK